MRLAGERLVEGPYVAIGIVELPGSTLQGAACCNNTTVIQILLDAGAEVGMEKREICCCPAIPSP